MAALPKQKGFVREEVTSHKEGYSVTCLDWDANNPKTIVSGSDDKTVKLWDIDGLMLKKEKCIWSVDCSKYGEITCVKYNDKLNKLWICANDCKLYEFDSRNLNKGGTCLWTGNDEINDLKYDLQNNCLWMADDSGCVTKYDLKSNLSKSMLFHEKSVCTSIALLNDHGFCAGTDSMILQFLPQNLGTDDNMDDIFCYSINDLIDCQSEKEISCNNWINPPFVYSLDLLESTSDISDFCYIVMALGNGCAAILRPQLIKSNSSNSSNSDDTSVIQEPFSLISLHKQACCAAQFARFNCRLFVTAGSDGTITVNSWADKKDNIVINPLKQFQLPNKNKPNHIITTNNDKAKIFVADTSNKLQLYLWK